ncbi:hypothetical protein EA462_02225 [Natrarchaeobius halalkaliphilus]|uniref:Uncharacterized protein n=1 Tax=Natrarchaeobius halalkaliphilus TaxID=1679091 RepID=A0A3N6M9S2_9EURY|nr:hypothetical protein EA462_02225 [Natrarchaeobius halalkaliphilus]
MISCLLPLFMSGKDIYWDFTNIQNTRYCETMKTISPVNLTTFTDSNKRFQTISILKLGLSLIIFRNIMFSSIIRQVTTFFDRIIKELIEMQTFFFELV